MSVSIDYKKLKQLDEFAKLIGLTIYKVKYGFCAENSTEHYTAQIDCLNIEPERLKNEPHLVGLASVL